MVLREEEQNLEKHMGCMAGFFQMFDRHQILAGKRVYSTRRLPSSPGTNSPSPSERSDGSPTSFSKESPSSPLEKPTLKKPEISPARPSLPLPVLEFKEGAKSSWKLREAPRLSLDSRLLEGKRKLFPPEIRTTLVLPAAPGEHGDVSDGQRRSPSVVARLMGLDALPKFAGGESVPAAPTAQLRRSASESRVSRDLLQCPFLQERNGERNTLNERPKPETKSRKPPISPSPMTPTAFSNGHRKSHFNAQEFFPEPLKNTTNMVPAITNSTIAGGGGNIYCEIEKRLRLRGNDEPTKDLETLKQILEALQLKGLLHSRAASQRRHLNGRNLVPESQSPIILMKPSTRTNSPRKTESTLNSPHKDNQPISDPKPPRRDPTRINGILPDSTSPISPVRRATPRGPSSDRRISPAQSPRAGTSPRKSGSSPSDRSPRIRRQPKVDRIHQDSRFSDESSSISESSHSTCSQFDIERVKLEEFREGRNLLERCDKLLHSIAEITTAIVAEQQPSPVSVLDCATSFCGDSTPATLKRRIVFGDEEDRWGPVLLGCTEALLPVDDAEAEDQDFVHVAEIFELVDVGVVPSLDVHMSLEKKQHKDRSKVSRLHRRLVFDTVTEIVERGRQMTLWNAFTWSQCTVDVKGASPRKTWVELRTLREHLEADDLCELVCGMLRKDMMLGNGGNASEWSDRPEEMSDAVLDIERLIFKDLVSETIRDLSTILPSTQRCKSTTTMPSLSRRKLLF